MTSAPAAEAKLRAAIDVAWPSMVRLLGAQDRKARQAQLHHRSCGNGGGADFIHEAAPEREDLKIKLFREIERDRPARRRSSPPRPPASCRRGCSRECSASRAGDHRPSLQPGLSAAAGRDRSRRRHLGERHGPRPATILPAIGMHVLRLKKEIDGLYLRPPAGSAVARGAAHASTRTSARPATSTTRIVYSAGLRWAFMGSFLTYHLAGGPGGMRDFIKQFDPTPGAAVDGPAISQMERTLERRLDRGLRNPGGRPLRRRDRGQAQRGAGRHDAAASSSTRSAPAWHSCARRRPSAKPRPVKRWKAGAKIDGRSNHGKAPSDAAWLDYNGHMTGGGVSRWPSATAADACVPLYRRRRRLSRLGPHLLHRRNSSQLFSVR